jgi:hypothetical protein
VLTVWLYDMIYTFQKRHSLNMDMAAAKLNDISNDLGS